MISLIVRILLMVAALITSWFVAQDAVNFTFVQMTVAVLIFTLFVGVIAFWPAGWTQKLTRRSHTG